MGDRTIGFPDPGGDNQSIKATIGSFDGASDIIGTNIDGLIINSLAHR